MARNEDGRLLDSEGANSDTTILILPPDSSDLPQGNNIIWYWEYPSLLTVLNVSLCWFPDLKEYIFIVIKKKIVSSKIVFDAITWKLTNKRKAKY